MSERPQSTRNPDYYAKRAAEERRLASAAADPNVRAIHLEMAAKYGQLAGADAPAPVIEEQRTAG